MDRLRRFVVLVPSVSLALALVSVTLPLYRFGPGPPRNVVPLIDVDDLPTYDVSGRLLLTTVTFDHPTVVTAIAAWLDPATELVPERAYLAPGQTEREYDRQSRSDMDESKLAAVSVVLSRLTDYPKERAAGALVYHVLPDSPAEGRLFPGDRIVAADGTPVRGIKDLSPLIRAAGTSRPVRITVEVEGKRETIPVRPARVEGEPHPILGVEVIPPFPVDIRISSGDIGGPSAGLMWAVGLDDLLTPGDLSGGRSIAGTGAIDLRGRVLPIGGIEEKVIAADRAGVDLFLVPRGNLAAARAAGAGVRLVPVRTVGEALRALEGS